VLWALPCWSHQTGNRRGTHAFPLYSAYLLQSWHPSTRPPTLAFDQQQPVKWLGLKIIQKQAGREDDDTGTVEFIARYKVNGKAQRLHEISQFVRESGRWVYLQGKMSNTN